MFCAFAAKAARHMRHKKAKQSARDIVITLPLEDVVAIHSDDKWTVHPLSLVSKSDAIPLNGSS
jgi:hypothetical protein